MSVLLRRYDAASPSSPGIPDEISLESICTLWHATRDGRTEDRPTAEMAECNLAVYMNRASFDLSLRLGLLEDHLRAQDDGNGSLRDSLEYIEEMRHDLRLISEVANYSVGQSLTKQ